ncbi:MAG TPA: NAD-dependent epimerase/dehydratase family protein [Polyangiaceae bacterium]|nr:NAD-dependent epimerase/dehydratase family protein [Polyangiaceae bacterium]
MTASSLFVERTAQDSAVIVTGVCGRLGRRLLRFLHRERPVVGMDQRPFGDRPADVEHYELDVRSKRAREVFRHGVGALVHLGVMHDPRIKSSDSHAWNLKVFQKLLEYVETFQIPKLVLLSSANVYGPRADNPQFLSEEAPLLGAGPFSEIRALVELDIVCQSFFWRNPSTETVILRPSHILGTVRNAPSNYLRLGLVPRLLGFDPMMQVVHQDDVVRALLLSLRPGMRGIYNVAGPPPVALSRAIEILGRNTVALPHAVARVMIERLFKLRVTSFPAPELDFIRYVCMVDDTRARERLGYAPRYSLEETLRAVDEERWAS